ncbi:MAG: fibronectin type III domain-containing protein [bacterium]|nr:fibronectin type III domain-containing protein [bacterium]
MLVQKKGINKKTKNLLIILGSIIILGGGYFVWNYFSTRSSSDQDNILPSNSDIIASKNIKTNLDTELFDDPQFQNLERDQYEGFVDQAEGISLSDSNPIGIDDISVNNPKTGASLVVFWKLPAFINFDKVVIYRSTNAGQPGEQIASIDVSPADSLKVDSYKDVDLNNNTNYYYLVDPQISEEISDSDRNLNVNPTVVSGQQVSGVPSDEIAPASPSNIQVIGTSDGEMKLSWNNPDDEDLDKINIYRSTEKGSLGIIINEISSDEFEEYMREGNNMIYVDQQIKLNTVYYYTVTSIDVSGNESTTDVLAAPYKSYFYNPFQPLDF